MVAADASTPAAAEPVSPATLGGHGGWGGAWAWLAWPRASTDHGDETLTPPGPWRSRPHASSSATSPGGDRLTQRDGGRGKELSTAEP